MAYFPFMIQMEDKLCLIAGGGTIARHKAEMMLSFGAQIRLIAPQICKELWDLAAQTDALDLHERAVEVLDLEGVDVAILATDDAVVNHRMAQECKRRHILVNVVDVKEDCGFYFPALIKQDDVVVAVSTGGDSPVLASHIKREIAAQMRDDYGRIARELGDMRQTVLEQTPPGKRKAAFEKLLEERLRDGAE